MSGSYGIDPDTGDFTIEYNDRITTTSAGTLICLSPELESFTSTVEFADPPSDIAYAYILRKERSTQLVGSTITYGARSTQTCQCQFTRLPHEETIEQVLKVAPAGADIFVGELKLVRTVNPTHTWFASNLDVKLKQDYWIPWNGSGLVEAAIGLSRGIHLFIKPNVNPLLPGSLVLQNQQSVMGKAGGYGPGDITTFPNSGSNRTDFEVIYDTQAGLPVWTSTSSPYRKGPTEHSLTSTLTPPSAANPTFYTLRRGNSDQCSDVDPTNYRSVYTVNVRGWFGKRSIAT